MTEILLYDYPGSICSQMARLALSEKGVVYARQTIDIMKNHEQFEPWYVALNPKAVVPTLRIGSRIFTDTINIVTQVDALFDGPSLSPADPVSMQQTMSRIMGLHYGVLLYSGRSSDDGISPTIITRGKFLKRMLNEHPDRAELLKKRIEGNAGMQSILADPVLVEHHVEAARAVVNLLDDTLDQTEFVSADHYTLADTFATAALARFRMHGLERWWSDGENTHVRRYYDTVKARPSWADAAVVDGSSSPDLV